MRRLHHYLLHDCPASDAERYYGTLLLLLTALIYPFLPLSTTLFLGTCATLAAGLTALGTQAQDATHRLATAEIAHRLQ